MTTPGEIETPYGPLNESMATLEGLQEDQGIWVVCQEVSGPRDTHTRVVGITWGEPSAALLNSLTYSDEAGMVDYSATAQKVDWL